MLEVQDSFDQADERYRKGDYISERGYLARASRLWVRSGAEGRLMPADGIEFDVRPRRSLDLD